MDFKIQRRAAVAALDVSWAAVREASACIKQVIRASNVIARSAAHLIIFRAANAKGPPETTHISHHVIRQTTSIPLTPRKKPGCGRFRLQKETNLGASCAVCADRKRSVRKSSHIRTDKNWCAPLVLGREDVGPMVTIAGREATGDVQGLSQRRRGRRSNRRLLVGLHRT